MKDTIQTHERRSPFVWKRPVVTDRRPVLRLVSSDLRWDVRLVGQTTRQRFLVTHPVDDGRLVFVKEGACFGVSNFDGAVVSAFDSTVLRVLLGEAPGLELSLPAPEARRREVLRRARRVAVTLPCSIRYGEGDDALRAGFTADLSEQGAQVAIERPLPGNVRTVGMSVRLPMFGDAVTVQLPAIVRSSVPDPRADVNATLLGLMFEALDPVVRLSLAYYVGERLLAESDDVFGAIR